MKINIKKVQREIIDGISVLTEVHLVNDYHIESFDEKNNFNYKITNNNELYYKNDRITKSKQKFNLSKKETKKEYGYDPIKITVEDLPFLEEIVEHWNQIKDKFVKIISSGQSMIGHISTSYYFPNGIEKICYNENFKKQHPESLPDFLERVNGKSIDNKFPSDFATYTEGTITEQHYKHGRFDYYLEAQNITIEDEKTIQQIGYYGDDLDKVIELLKFIKANPSNAMERLLGGYEHV